MDRNIRCLSILGSTGSIGRQTLEIVDLYPQQFKVVALAANDEKELLLEQIRRYRPAYVCVASAALFRELQWLSDQGIELYRGVQGMCRLAELEAVDTVVAAVSGAVGILPVMTAIAADKRVALANKETLVAAGEVVMAALNANAARMIPVDSEHSALFQCLRDEGRFLKKLWITASGGPFREFTEEQLKTVTLEMALKHPNWSMGPKITVDSSTLMNKGLEVIEAHHLFAADYDKIEVLVQRESVIHSMAEFVDGSFLAHLGRADMRVPIQYALTYPDRQPSPVTGLNFLELDRIHFERPDLKRFPCLELALAAGRAGGTLPAVMNAANEVAVHRFLAGGLDWWRIPLVVEQVMARHESQTAPALDDILAADKEARALAAEALTVIAKG